ANGADGKPVSAAAQPVNTAVAHVELTPAATIAVNGAAQLTYALRDGFNRVVTGRVIHWTSRDPAVAVVDSNGVVHALRVGKTAVTAESEGKTAVATVDVTDQAIVAKSVSLSPRDSTVEAGAKLPIVATVAGASGANLIGTPVDWKSSAPIIASVDPAT